MPRNTVERQPNVLVQDFTRPDVDLARVPLDQQTKWILDHNEGMEPNAAGMIALVMFNHLRNTQIPEILRSKDPAPTDEEVWDVLANHQGDRTLFKTHEFDKYQVGGFFKSWMDDIRLASGL